MSDMLVSTLASTPLTREQWDEISRQLREPFDPREVDFRAQGRASEQTGKAQVVAYIDARAVQDRLDAVVGAGNWSFDWTPLVVEKGEVMVAKGTLIIHGVAKADAGSASNFEQSLGAVSHCFKRAAVHWGVGRYLYSLPMNWVPVEKNGRIADATLRELRSRLPRPSAQSAAQATPAAAVTPSAPTLMTMQPEAAPASAGSDYAQTVAGQEVRETPAVAPATERRTAPTRATPRSATGPAAPAAPATQPTPHAASATSAPQAAPNSGSLGSSTALPGAQTATNEPFATEQQLVSIRKLCAALGKPEPEAGLSYAQARQIITQLSGEYQRARRAS
ncbi:MAG TPA: Rad52/Rad22 family DNA repair protein [Ktedonobacterales bacterium]|nr:Rad52/Rad22 family DNA repair protein [Ktedonobacterales bacterium]